MLSIIPVLILILLFMVFIMISQGCRIYVINISMLCIFIVIGLGFFIDVIDKERFLVKNGRYYITHCKIIDINIGSVFFQSNIIKLKCDKLVESVTSEYYQKAIESYESSLNNNQLIFNYKQI